jgi:cellobiose-specific phosphotransferase system component IIB
MRKMTILLLAMAFSLAALAQDTTKPDDAKNTETKKQETPSTEAKKKIAPNSKVFLAPMGGFEDELKTAIQKKKVPVVLVTDKDQADYEIAGTSETEKAGVAKKVVMWNWHSNEQASITVTEHKSGEVVFAYSVNKQSSAHGKRSTAEACAKHLKEQIECK